MNTLGVLIALSFLQVSCFGYEFHFDGKTLKKRVEPKKKELK